MERTSQTEIYISEIKILLNVKTGSP